MSLGRETSLMCFPGGRFLFRLLRWPNRKHPVPTGEQSGWRDQVLSLWSGSTDSKILEYQRTNPQFSSVTQLCPTLCDPMNHSTPGLPVHHQLLEFTQTHAHRVGDAIQPSHPLSSPSPAPNPSQHQGLFQWVNSLHEVAKVLEFQLQHLSFQWTPRTDLL